MPTGIYPRTPKQLPDPLPRFWSKVLKTDTCWLWRGGLDKDGYGRFWCEGQTHRAHVWIFERMIRPLAKEEQCCHTCDTPGCVRYPDHLHGETQAQNIQDAVTRDRWPQGQRDKHGETVGERNGNHQLTAGQVLEIRRLYERGEAPYYSLHSLRSLATLFGVSKFCIQSIIHRQTWAHLRDSEIA